MANPIFRFLAQWFIERPANKRTVAELISRLERSSGPIIERATTVTDTPANRKQLRHIIGIERWGQRRLRAFLGEPPPHDEYDGYQPADSLTLAELTSAFQQTRQETLALARQAEAAGVPPTAKVAHNAAGDFSLRAWLGYLNSHAEMESKRLK
jgi:hypothetical protein